MRVLPVNSPQTFFSGSEQPAGNLSSASMYIVALLDKVGIQTKILDAFMANCSFQKNGETLIVSRLFERIKQAVLSKQVKPNQHWDQNLVCAVCKREIRIVDSLMLCESCQALIRLLMVFHVLYLVPLPSIKKLSMNRYLVNLLHLSER